jgi:alpha-methylacyl-CoA racemase
MTDGVSTLTAMFHGLRASGHLGPRGSNGLDGGAPYYRTYETSDGKWMAVGAIEPQFYRALLAGLELDPDGLPAQADRRQWPALQEAFAGAFRTRSRDEWIQVFTQVDACVSPVLSVSEVGTYNHHVARESFIRAGGNLQPAPAPRMSAAPGDIHGPPPTAGQHTVEVLRDWGVPDEIAAAALRDHAAWSQP